MYEPATGELEYFINDVSKIRFNVGVVPESSSPTMDFFFEAYGWFTGHYLLMDDLVVTQSSSTTPANFDEDFNFDDNRTPAGWAINVDPRATARTSVTNQRFEAREVDTYSGLFRSKELPTGSNGLEISYIGNITSNYWGQKTAIHLFMENGTLIETNLGKAISGSALIVASAGVGAAPEYVETFGLATGIYEIKSLFEDGQITYSATKQGATAPLFNIIVSVPSLQIHNLDKLELFAHTTTGETSWIDNVKIRALTPTPTPGPGPTPGPSPTPGPLSFSIRALPSPAYKGVVYGSGIFVQGTTVTLRARVKRGHTFVKWTENGRIVSRNRNYTFNVTRPRTLVAHFR